MVDDSIGVVLQRDVTDEGEMEAVMGDGAQRGNGQPQQLEKKGFRKRLRRQQLLLRGHSLGLHLSPRQVQTA